MRYFLIDNLNITMVFDISAHHRTIFVVMYIELDYGMCVPQNIIYYSYVWERVENSGKVRGKSGFHREEQVRIVNTDISSMGICEVSEFD